MLWIDGVRVGVVDTVISHHLHASARERPARANAATCNRC